MKKSPQIPHTYVIVFAIIFLAAMLTWIIPGGQFSRQTIRTSDGTREVIDAHSFQSIDHQPQTWQIFSAFYKGFIRTPKIIVFILILGGAFWLLNESKAVDVGVYSFLAKTQKFNRYKFFRKIGVNNLIIAVVMLIFSFFCNSHKACSNIFRDISRNYPGVSQAVFLTAFTSLLIIYSFGYIHLLGMMCMTAGSSRNICILLLNSFKLSVFPFILFDLLKIIGIIVLQKLPGKTI